MGSGKLKMELIANEKLRCRTFRNRQKGLKKKLQELSTLCDVEACMIMYCDCRDPSLWETRGTQLTVTRGTCYHPDQHHPDSP
ncbi:hypothetical protein VitviT2T_026252 [Vitis vinifera]|uniref:MADS-box domain-containing protein n=1 Tax=Vitis vinifera TaxID=29760 RepID=A0ABY9DLE3_VITVI|nr:hypothetical protein VitviT2T_026252 [Vitis vinifera]